MHWRPFAPWILIILLLAAIGMVTAIAIAVLRDAADALHAIIVAQVRLADRAEAGRWIRVCMVVAGCRGAMIWALGESIRAHVPMLRVTFGFILCWTACALLLPGRTPLARSAVGSARYALPHELRRLTVRTGEAWVPLGYWPPAPFLGGLLRLHRFHRAFRALVGAQVYLPTDDLARHVLVVGLTGAYKTTAVTFPVLLEAARQGVSVVALDQLSPAVRKAK